MGPTVASSGFQSCPTDVIQASRAAIWELLIQPARMTWMDARLVEAPDRAVQPGDVLRFRAGPLGAFAVRMTVGGIREQESTAPRIELPPGIVNDERIELRDTRAGTRVTFN